MKKLCPSGSKEYQRRKRSEFFAANPGKHAKRLAYARAHYRSNKKRHLLVCKLYRLRNSAAQKEKKRKYYLKNRERISSYSKRRYSENREKRIAKTNEWRARNWEYVKRYRRHRYKTDGGYRMNYIRNYQRRAWKDGRAKQWQRNSRKRKRQMITNAYAREMLTKHSNLSAKDFPPELVELKKAQLRLKQELETNTTT